MTVGKLRELIEGVDAGMTVLIPVSQEFDGAFYSPCSEDSGVSAVGMSEALTEDDIKEMELLDKPLPEKDHFLLLPCGFTNEKDHSHELN